MITLADIQAKVSAEILATKDPQQIADAFNAGRTKVGKVSREDFAVWTASTGMRSVIEDLSVDKTSPLRDASLACLDVLRGAAAAIDFSITANMQMLGAWVAFGMLTQANHDALIALATYDDFMSLREITMALIDDSGAWRY
jgi:hypothetical protein